MKTFILPSLLLALVASTNVHAFGHSKCQDQAKLVSASTDGDFKTVSRLLARGSDVDVIDCQYGETALMMAAWNGHTDIAKALIAAKAKVDLQDFGGESALMKAVWNDGSDIVNILIAAKATVNLQDASGLSALMKASRTGNGEIVNALIVANANLDDLDNSGESALIHAVETGAADIVSVLIKAKANLNIQLSNGATALTVATNHDIGDLSSNFGKGEAERMWLASSRIADELILAGANIELPSCWRMTALQFAAANGNVMF